MPEDYAMTGNLQGFKLSGFKTATLMISVSVHLGKKNHCVAKSGPSKYLICALEKALISKTFSYFPVLTVILSSEY